MAPIDYLTFSRWRFRSNKTHQTNPLPYREEVSRHCSDHSRDFKELPKPAKNERWIERVFSHKQEPKKAPKKHVAQNGSRSVSGKRPRSSNVDSEPVRVVITKPLPSEPVKDIEDPNSMLPEGKEDMAEMLQLVEQHFSSYFEAAGVEPSSRKFRLKRPFEQQKEAYQWQLPGTTYPSYPPCVSVIPPEEIMGFLQLFNAQRLIDTSAALLPSVPKMLSDYLYGEPIGTTMAGLEARMARLRRAKKNVGTVPSVANRPDWYTDSIFAQQSFTGCNPTSITRASDEWITRFKQSATDQNNEGMSTLLQTVAPAQMFIQDYSYFRSAVGSLPDSALRSDDGKRFGCAAVTLFHLTSSGDLHPLAIVLDYRGSMVGSVVVFNKRLSPADPKTSEATDWPWRYAKMCHQVSEWTHHQLVVHLNDCHFVQEAIIVSAQRSFPADHIVHTLLEPHWLKTLSLNAAGRATLVPEVVVNINGFTKDQTYAFILDAYKRFDFKANYVPNDLKRRGFPVSDLQQQDFHNYPWAKNMAVMWETLHKFISAMLKTVYHLDEHVEKDACVAAWCSEMQSSSGGQMSSFPNIQTIDDLVNAVVMCIHIACPQHTSINYLQSYYMSFVPNKPASLMAPLPSTLAQLMKYKESDVMNALPIKDPRVWLLSSQLPYLLSYGVQDDQTLVMYAKSLQVEAKQRKKDNWQQVEQAGKQFYEDLLGLVTTFDKHSDAMDSCFVPYHVMDPMEMSVSILI